MKKILLVMALTTSLGGCALFQAMDSTQRSILQGGTSVTATAPVSIKQEYTVETLYNGAMRAYRVYLRLPTCKTPATLSNVCRDPATVAMLSRARKSFVEPALVRARIAQRQGVSAIDILSDFRAALTPWVAAIPTAGG